MAELVGGSGLEWGQKSAPLEIPKGAPPRRNKLISHPWNFQTSMGAVKSQNALGNRIDANIGFVFAPMQPAQTLAKIPKVKASSRF
ncbi:hypothetical protein JKL07_03200 [Lactiplantibacillus argentoratensis]|uniref:Uncharacterized protein n=1 Tax=Lactiplantibacillus argentoratensis TaxID=271881 RepID=A0ABS5UF67_9LACO|nr:hypothetical protein [Lactiplantibacillus argentoratensis]AYC73145.1 hypothetical protein D5289_14495 [Lactiplantibacillus plantarum]MBP5808958.1 hypothetical protein [Lactiplantibacillus argentoratensis]MBT1137223.1 hypothetical protein [Lactiplantibacillus argentoratensis]MBT1145721.1 hypothetical protein [Lactiplantibacillus argentoratensis]RDG01952.1 hypothetical protein DQM19_05685 [Lactiplantibacillus plantarum]